MIRTPEHNLKISLALKGKKKSENHKKSLSKQAKKRFAIPENNPNYKGDKVGYQGIHIWLRKTCGLATHCEKCGMKGEYKNGKWNVVYALRKGKTYQRRREYFWMLCNKCHIAYDGLLKKRWKITP